MSRIQTVLGQITPDKLGNTLPHEHLLTDLLVWWQKPVESSKIKLVNTPITLENLHLVHRNWMFFKDNLRLYDVEEAIKELSIFKRAGGHSLVDLTLPGIGRDPKALREISIATGVNIIMGTGWYLKETHPSYVKKENVNGLKERMIKELTEGIGYTGIKAGLIGECALGYPMHKDEIKIIKAASKAQSEVGCAFTIHPPLLDYEKKTLVQNAKKIIKIIQREGADLGKFYLSHMDGSPRGLGYQKKIMDTYGIVISFDQFGFSTYADAIFPGCGGLSDKHRVDAVVELCESGYEKQLMLSHDVCTKMKRVRYGGYGYGHILNNIVPELRYRGVTEKQIRTMIVDNPKRLLERAL